MRKSSLSYSFRHYCACVVDSYKYDKNIEYLMLCTERLQSILHTELFSKDFLFEISYFWVSEWFKTSGTKYKISRKKKFLELDSQTIHDYFMNSKKSKNILAQYKNECNEDELKEVNAFLYYLEETK